MHAKAYCYNELKGVIQDTTLKVRQGLYEISQPSGTMRKLDVRLIKDYQVLALAHH